MILLWNGKSLIGLGFYRLQSDVIGFSFPTGTENGTSFVMVYRVLPRFTEFYRVLPSFLPLNFIFHRVMLMLIGMNLNGTGFYRL